jgi:hypothetical protein
MLIDNDTLVRDFVKTFNTKDSDHLRQPTPPRLTRGAGRPAPPMDGADAVVNAAVGDEGPGQRLLG